MRRTGWVGCVLRHGYRASAGAALLVAALATVLASLPAQALVIDPTFDSSITGNANAAAIEGSINSAIGTIDRLYSNPVDVAVTFTYDPAGSGNLLSTDQYYYSDTYTNYKNALAADAAAHPGNTVLATALANLPFGNNASGTELMVLSGADSQMLEAYGLSNYGPSSAVININSSQTFGFTQPVSSGVYDLTGGLEHELDEVLGGGGAGSTLNAQQQGACTTGSDLAFFCDTYGPLDPYRYSGLHDPSYSESGANPYLSVDGGNTPIVSFNENPGGDYGDFYPDGGGGSPSGPGQLIQNAFNGKGPDEPYTNRSPEFVMEESIGWDPVPEPGTLALLASSLLGLRLVRQRRA